jgi:ferredoxin/flavodoxin
MNNYIRDISNLKIAYFSGTGNTKKVAACFGEVFKSKSIDTAMLEIGMVEDHRDMNEDMLVVLFPVHAFNAPEPVYEWVLKLDQVDHVKAVVISVSGGGEVTPNNACRLGCISRLQKKGYEVVYEKMIVMPSNIFVKTGDELALRLLEILPFKVEDMVKEVLEGRTHRTKPNMINRCVSVLGEFEKSGTGYFGKRIRAGKDCDGCGWCEKNCPRKNITIKNNEPVFGGKCILCLKCIYGCPRKALKPGAFKFFVFKDGYNLSEMEKGVTADGRSKLATEDLARGYLWKGVREYILD